jgi:hypothetical protein
LHYKQVAGSVAAVEKFFEQASGLGEKIDSGLVSTTKFIFCSLNLGAVFAYVNSLSLILPSVSKSCSVGFAAAQPTLHAFSWFQGVQKGT